MGIYYVSVTVTGVLCQVISFKPKGNALGIIFTMSKEMCTWIVWHWFGNIVTSDYADDTLMAEGEEE